jgi:hypothetical protein
MILQAHDVVVRENSFEKAYKAHAGSAGNDDLKPKHRFRKALFELVPEEKDVCPRKSLRDTQALVLVAGLAV